MLPLWLRRFFWRDVGDWWIGDPITVVLAILAGDWINRGRASMVLGYVTALGIVVIENFLFNTVVKPRRGGT